MDKLKQLKQLPMDYVLPTTGDRQQDRLALMRDWAARGLPINPAMLTDDPAVLRSAAFEEEYQTAMLAADALLLPEGYQVDWSFDRQVWKVKGALPAYVSQTRVRRQRFQVGHSYDRIFRPQYQCTRTRS